VDIAAWLRELGLERYEQAFRENEIDAAILPRLTSEDLREIGVAAIGHRRRLLDAIAALRKATAPISAGLPAEAVRKSAEPERRQLTVLFVDLVGSTELSAQLDAEELREVIGAYQACVAVVVRRWDGHVARYLGDGALAYFGWPRAHEDDAERAVRAGLELVDEVGLLRAGAEVPLAARIGIATGQVVVGDLIGQHAADMDSVVGETPNLAARLQAVAQSGEVVISHATRRLVGGLFVLDDLGPQRLKGFSEPLAVWRVAGESRAEGRFEARQTAGLTALVGRDEEIALLLRRWQQVKDSEGQVVLLSGEPGIGKSRLVRELRGRLEGEPHICLLRQCSPHHQTSPLHPVIEQLERAAGFERDDPPATKLDKLEVLLAQGTEKLDEAVPLVAALLGVSTGDRYLLPELTPQRQKQRTLEMLVDQLEGLAARQPVLLVYEDAHWIDPTTQELLGLAIERIQHLAVLAIVTFRPDFQPPWTGLPHVSLLPLTRLGRRDGAAMVDRVVGSKPLPPEVSAQIVGKTDGVPLFVEELTKAVLESGLIQDAGDRYELIGPLPPLAIPSTLHDSLLARLDHLAPVKELAQIGAAIGREFSHALLAAVADRPETELQAALDRLVSSELVFHRGTPPETIYSFKHALVQDAAYGTLLKSRRQQLHARIARVLEERFPETVGAQPELLAQHYTAAGLHDQAVDYWHRAGQRASERSADLEAIAHLTKGLKLARTLPDPTQAARQELKLLVALGEPLVAARGFGAPEVGTTYTRALELCRELDNTRHLFPTMWGLWHFYRGRGALRRARDLGDDLMGLAERYGDPMLLLAAHQALGHSLYHLGELSAALSHLEQARAGLDPKLDRSPYLRYGIVPGVQSTARLAQLLWCLGYPDQALRRSREAVESARELAHLHSLACSMYFAIRLHLLRRETLTADELAEAALALSTKHGFAFWSSLIVFMQGWSLCQQGRGSEGVARMRTGFADAEATGAKMMRPMFCALLTEGYGQLGQLHEAWRMLSDALGAVEESGQRHYEAEMYRFKGQLHLRESPPDVEQAVTCFQRALDIARQQQAKSWELRAAMSLARLWRDQGRPGEAHDLLAPIHGWFTEGFDTADLKDAQALLDEVS
jgi:class 3 adenylate cyclase/predicted ATPase